MKNRIYNAFIKAGFESEARKLSEKADKKIRPSLGHYIAILDNHWKRAEEKEALDSSIEKDNYKALVSSARNYIRAFLEETRGEINQKAGKDNLIPPRHSLETDSESYKIIEKFIDYFNQSIKEPQIK